MRAYRPIAASGMLWTRRMSASLLSTRLLWMIALAKYRPPDFIKCDVEGAEGEVFQGARRLLEKHRPRVLCEIHSERSRELVLSEFSRFDYLCENCDDNHILALPK